MDLAPTQNRMNKEQNLVMVLAIVYGGGIIAHLVPFLYQFTQYITDALLLVSNLAVLYFVYQKNPSTQLIVWCVVAALITFALEVLGVATGQVFGAYEYGKTMYWQILNVPVVIGLNWIVLMLAGLDIAQNYLKFLFPPLLAAIMVVAFDWVMEPVAIQLDYWHWFGQPIPLQNYLAWFVIALGAGSVFHFLKIKVDSFVLRAYFFIQLLFFVGLRLVL